MNVLIIGNNPKHAKVFSIFADNIYLLLQNQNNGVYRTFSETSDYNLIHSNLEYGSKQYKSNRKIEISEIIKQNNIDVVFSNRRDDMVEAKKATGTLLNKPILLVTFHNSTAWISNLKALLMSLMVNMCCDGCVCLADFMYKKMLRGLIPKKKLLYLPNTIQYENFSPKQDYGIDIYNVKVCYTAVISPLKNQRYIIDVINILQSSYHFDMHFYGDLLDEEYYSELLKLVRSYGLEDQIHFDGRIPYEKIKMLLCDSDVYFSSTTLEMSPYNILEAKASSLPILATNVPGQKDLIENCVDGVLCNISDIYDAADKLRKILENQEFRTMLGKKAYQAVSNEKSYKVAANKLSEFITKIKGDKENIQNNGENNEHL